jgi:group I intron endonuclease
MSAIIYLLTNTINGKTYVGLSTKTLEQRWSRHCRSARGDSSCHIHNAIRKYGPDAFTHHIIEETTKELMFDRERYWISVLTPEYNMTEGGQGGIPSDDVRKRLSNAQKAFLKRNPEHQQKLLKAMHDARRGKPQSQETREKIRAKLTGRKLTPQHRATLRRPKKYKKYKRVLTPEHRQKISDAMRRKNLANPV